MAEGEKLYSFHRPTENSLAHSHLDQMGACIGESSVASSTSDQSEIAASSISTSPAAAYLKTVEPVFPSSKLTHSSDSSLVAVPIKVPVIIHSWRDEQRVAQLVTGSQKPSRYTVASYSFTYKIYM